jgi:hypothetical protein
MSGPFSEWWTIHPKPSDTAATFAYGALRGTFYCFQFEAARPDPPATDPSSWLHLLSLAFPFRLFEAEEVNPSKGVAGHQVAGVDERATQCRCIACECGEQCSSP